MELDGGGVAGVRGKGKCGKPFNDEKFAFSVTDLGVRDSPLNSYNLEVFGLRGGHRFHGKRPIRPEPRERRPPQLPKTPRFEKFRVEPQIPRSMTEKANFSAESEDLKTIKNYIQNQNYQPKYDIKQEVISEKKCERGGVLFYNGGERVLEEGGGFYYNEEGFLLHNKGDLVRHRRLR